ncbi:MAG TPA: family 20 glycosylhydrolase [bacterium]|nr:family 20 glycosylhydrolase [bacterium]HPN45126.1 family 20 glycosylhydrolase [bacterium]
MKNNEKNLKYFLLPNPQECTAGVEQCFMVEPLTVYTPAHFTPTALQLVNELETEYNCRTIVQHHSTVSVTLPGIHLVTAADINSVKSVFGDKQIPDFTECMKDEGYIITIRQNTIVIIAETTAGMFYGMNSFLFLLSRQNGILTVPECVIRDWPDMRLRGFSDDISRGQVSTLAHFKRIICFLARYKMNVYMPYLEDLFQFKSYPGIGRGRGALTPEECIELQDFAAQYHIEIIPVFQTLGHYENLLIQPEFMHLADFPGASSLNTVTDNTVIFLDKLLAEIVPVFRSIYFHIGADESYDVGSGASRDKARRQGIAAVHADHYEHVFNILKKYHKKIIMYGDIILEFPDILQRLPDDIIIMDWHYDIQEEYTSVKQFRNSGHKFIVSPGNQNWSRIFPDLERARQNIYRIIRDGHNNGACGAITSSWGDFGGANLRELNYYQIAFAAQCAWRKGPVDQDAFEAAFFMDFYGNDDPGYAQIYKKLSQVCEYYDSNYFFSQPFYPLSRPVDDLVNRSNNLIELHKEVIKEINRLRQVTIKNPSHLDLLEFSANQYNWTARLNKVQSTLHNAEARECASLPDELTILMRDLETIAETFTTLWLKYNLQANLEHILALFKRTAAWLDVKRAEIIAGNYKLNGRLEAPFIACPTTKTTEFSELYLRKKFNLANHKQPVRLQVIADSLATVWVNNRLVGQAIATRTLSAIVEAQRVKLWDISEYLTAGENLLAMHVINYKQGGVAAVNVVLESANRQLHLDGKDPWPSSNREEENWRLPDFCDVHWPTAIPAANAWIISRPEFHYGLSSRVEFYRNPIY